MPWCWILSLQYKCPSCLILGCRICRFFDPQEILKFDECTIYLFSRIRKKIQWQIWHFTNIDDAKESRNIVKCHFTSLCKKSVKYLDSRNSCFFKSQLWRIWKWIHPKKLAMNVRKTDTSIFESITNLQMRKLDYK